ncbi:septation ring formation regulator EzrA [Lentibacillus cibarius]|uniref:Septation ring formation regulator EzrA n=1 Tax=Lentibacillus cibarius TaxID=2583219 RepID=A0A549YM59_9BACI|nr:septation ring formation regulator EzrA [Lentibacillus cibarius]TRM12965.1 septation ring formation regulator EzrA [Lentibacillus cibarius]
MAYVIGTILAVIALITIGLIMRKKVYDVVDRLETWKMDIMNRNVASELGRIKQLNLSGETQEKFESWRDRWEQIIAKELPDIEEYLFDAEEAADRYRFSSAKKTLRYAEQTLQRIEKDIENMLTELDQLMNSEESARKEVEQIGPDIKSLRKYLIHNRFSFGKADVRFEVEIDELEEELSHYDDLVESGDYSKARELADNVKQKLDALQTEIEAFPDTYHKCKKELPEQLDELVKGLREMKQDGYRVEHLGFEKEIHDYQRRLIDCKNLLEKGDMAQANELIPEIDERIDEMYQLLEKEALAKNYVETKITNYRDALYSLEDKFNLTKEDMETLKQTYYVEDSDMEKYLSLDKSIVQLRNRLEEITDGLEKDNTAHSQLRDELEKGFQELDALQEKHEAFKERIHNLRKDETEAKAKLAEMKNELYNVNRKLKKSNIPGIPSYIWDKMEEAAMKNNRVFKTLEKQPLDITEVQQVLSEAETAVEGVIEQTDVMLDQAYLTEQVIQYANRYRSQYPALAAKLSEAERLFRSYEYDLALDQAARAVEEVDPGSLKRIESFQKAVN